MTRWGAGGPRGSRAGGPRARPGWGWTGPSWSSVLLVRVDGGAVGRVGEELDEAVVVDRSRVRVGPRGGKGGGARHVGEVEAEVAQADRTAEPDHEGLQPGGGVADTERGGRRAHGLRCRRCVVGHRVRQHHRVGGGMGQAEAAAEGVAELVVQPHADGGEAPARQPRSVEQVGARVQVVGVALQATSTRRPRRRGPRRPSGRTRRCGQGRRGPRPRGPWR